MSPDLKGSVATIRFLTDVAQSILNPDFINFPNLQFQFDEKNGELNYLLNGHKFAVWNLHIHSKNARLFDKDGWERELTRLVKISEYRKEIILFSF